MKKTEGENVVNQFQKDCASILTQLPNNQINGEERWEFKNLPITPGAV